MLLTRPIWHTCLMPKKDEAKEVKVLDIATLNTLVHRLEDFLRVNNLENATQATKAQAIGLAHQSDARKLLNKQHAPNLDKVQLISAKTGLPAWFLLMSKEEEATLRAIGVQLPSPKGTLSPLGKEQDLTPVSARKKATA